MSATRLQQNQANRQRTCLERVFRNSFQAGIVLEGLSTAGLAMAISRKAKSFESRCFEKNDDSTTLQP